MKKIIWFIIILVLGTAIWSFFFQRYNSSPGYVTQETADDFYNNIPKCYGFSILLNGTATAADAPGISVCIGLLRR